MDYFYSPPENISNNELIINEDEFAHLTHVMRKKSGDTICVVDGIGTAYDVRLDEIKKKTAHGTILQSYRNHHEPSVTVTIAVGILKNPSKFDFLVEKVTELGVREIVPLKTERTIPSHAKIDRWQKLALAAMKQCGRSYLPKVRELVTLNDYLGEQHSFNRKFIAHEQPSSLTKSRESIPSSSSPVVILIGPEGGFSDLEFDRCIEAGYEQLYFGARRLRTETAAIVTAALMLTP